MIIKENRQSLLCRGWEMAKQIVRTLLLRDRKVIVQYCTILKEYTVKLTIGGVAIAPQDYTSTSSSNAFTAADNLINFQELG
jgi:hypothetical protein